MLEESIHKITVEGELRLRRFRDPIQLPRKLDPREAVANTFLLIVLALWSVGAQAEPVECTDTSLTTQASITDEEDAISTSDLDVEVDGVKITATGATESGINQVHHGEGDITVIVSSSCIETSGTSNTPEDAASGIVASSDSATNPATNEGRVKIDVRDSTIMTEGPRAKASSVGIRTPVASTSTW